MGLFNLGKKNKKEEEANEPIAEQSRPKAYLIRSEEFENGLIDGACALLKKCDLEQDATKENVQVEFGYTMQIENRGGEALLRVTKDQKQYVIALQEGSLKLIGIKDQGFGVATDEKYKAIIDFMMDFWKPIDSSESRILAVQRREKNNEFIKSQGIVCYENLDLVEPSCDVKLKNIDEICIRAIVSFIAIQIACDINNGMYEESMKVFKPVLDGYKGYQFLNEKEKRVVDGTYTEQDAIDLDWEYEALWSLLYALSLVDDIRDGGKLCDCDYVISIFKDWPSLEELKAKCKLRDIEEILDMLDLYYRYDWAVNEKKVNKEANIGTLNPSNVIERRRGLEWLISNEDDWYNIPLDA